MNIILDYLYGVGISYIIYKIKLLIKLTLGIAILTQQKTLKGSLSPDFLKDKFQEHYQENETSERPAIQLSKFLNTKGPERWELSEHLKLRKCYFLS